MTDQFHMYAQFSHVSFTPHVITAQMQHKKKKNCPTVDKLTHSGIIKLCNYDVILLVWNASWI